MTGVQTCALPILEPSEGDVHFTEKLIRLKSPNIVFDRPEPVDERRERDVFDLPSNKNLYLCPQALYKFHPDFDPVLGKILRRDPIGILVIIRSRYGAWDEIFMERLSGHLDHPDRQIVMLSPMSRDKYLSLLRLGDVMLDPFPFCGGHTSLEALSFGVPVVTLPTGHTRGRLTYAFYRTFEMLDCVCNNPREYVELAVKLGTDRQANHKMRRKILKVCGILFENEGVVDDLADALIERLEYRFNGAGPSLQKARPYN